MSNELHMDSVLAVQRTIASLQTTYSEPLSIEQLAKQANLGIWQYRQLFKRITGSNPNDYITGLRMKRAQELLLVTQDRLSDIARSVGYEDEYYFIRRFRSMVGQAPRQYIRRKRAGGLKVVALSHLGDLLALRACPAVAEEGLLQGIGLGEAEGIAGIAPDEAGWAQLERLQPDLILTNAYTGAVWVDKLQSLAPVVALNTGQGMFAQLNEVAQLLGKQREEKIWLAQYGARALAVREQCRSWIGKRETAVFVHVVCEQLYVYRPEEAPVLYDVLGLEAPAALERLIRSKGASRLFIPVSRLAELEADHLFIAVGRMEGAQATWERLRRSASWRSLPAVQGQRVYRMQYPWTLDGSIALEWQLNGIVELLHGAAQAR